MSCLLLTNACAGELFIPQAAARYRADLIRAARFYWGLAAPIATFAAQVHQESGWRRDARSAYAHGLAQFTPTTATWIGGLDEALAGADTGNPTWALRALTRYDQWLFERVPSLLTADPADICARMAQTLRAYNGGLGWLQREAKSGKPCTAFRTAANCRENLAYPQRILHELEPRYLTAGWGSGSCS